MENKIIRDSKNNIVGQIRNTGNVTLVIDDKNNVIGKVQNNITFDKKNNYFGRGDQSQRLIK